MVVVGWAYQASGPQEAYTGTLEVDPGRLVLGPSGCTKWCMLVVAAAAGQVAGLLGLWVAFVVLVVAVAVVSQLPSP